MYALDCGDVYGAFELYLSAGMFNAAHDLAVRELAPDAVIRDDLELLKSLFEQFRDHPVDDWHVRGKVSGVRRDRRLRRVANCGA